MGKNRNCILYFLTGPLSEGVIDSTLQADCIYFCFLVKTNPKSPFNKAMKDWCMVGIAQGTFCLRIYKNNLPLEIVFVIIFLMLVSVYWLAYILNNGI
jgi:hypothetical protein